jgi:shikimate kinase
MMGSGKSTIGRLLSEATGWHYIDNDELVRRAHGTTARALLAERGEPTMRRAESDALALGLELPPPAIVGVAGGVILDPLDRDRLRAGAIVVWLRADAALLESRAIGADQRPWLDTSGASWLRRAVGEREPLYASVADLVLDTATGSPATAVGTLHRWLLAETPCGAAGSVRSRAPA